MGLSQCNSTLRTAVSQSIMLGESAAKGGIVGVVWVCAVLTSSLSHQPTSTTTSTMLSSEGLGQLIRGLLAGRHCEFDTNGPSRFEMLQLLTA